MTFEIPNFMTQTMNFNLIEQFLFFLGAMIIYSFTIPIVKKYFDSLPKDIPDAPPTEITKLSKEEAKELLMRQLTKIDHCHQGDVCFSFLDKNIIVNKRTGISYHMGDKVKMALSDEEIRNCMIDWHLKFLEQDNYRHSSNPFSQDFGA